MAQRQGEENLRPIPDGGLKESMPDWLRRPPAWRSLPDKKTGTAAFPPDTSEIDPRTLVDVNDLPAWLQEIAGRPVVEPTVPDPLGQHGVGQLQGARRQAPDREVSPTQLESTDQDEQPRTDAAPHADPPNATAESITVSSAPETVAIGQTSEISRSATSTNPPMPSGWRMALVGLIIFVLLALAAIAFTYFG